MYMDKKSFFIAGKEIKKSINTFWIIPSSPENILRMSSSEIIWKRVSCLLFECNVGNILFHFRNEIIINHVFNNINSFFLFHVRRNVEKTKALKIIYTRHWRVRHKAFKSLDVTFQMAVRSYAIKNSNLWRSITKLYIVAYSRYKI